MQNDVERDPSAGPFSSAADAGAELGSHDSGDSARGGGGVVRTPLTTHLDSLWS